MALRLGLPIVLLWFGTQTWAANTVRAVANPALTTTPTPFPHATVVTTGATNTSTSPLPKPTPKPRWRSFFTMSLVAWQESLVLTGPDNKTYNLNSNTQGVCPGVDFISSFSTRFAFQFSGCVLFGTSEVANSSSASATDLQYSAMGTHARGLVSSVGLLWTPPHAEKSRFGISIPIIFRSTDWPDPSAGTTLSTSNSAVLTGALIEEQFDLGKFLFVVKTGLVTSNFSWALQIGYNL